MLIWSQTDITIKFAANVDADIDGDVNRGDKTPLWYILVVAPMKESHKYGVSTEVDADGKVDMWEEGDPSMSNAVSTQMGSPGGNMYKENSFPEHVLHSRIQDELVSELNSTLEGCSLIHRWGTIAPRSDRWK